MERKDINYIINISIMIGFIIIIITGLIFFPGLVELFGNYPSNFPVAKINTIHSWLGLIIGTITILHFTLNINKLSKISNKVFQKIKSKRKNNRKFLAKYLTNIGLTVSFFITFITGIIKFSGFIQFFGQNPNTFPLYEISIIHDWNGLFLVGLTILHIFLHIDWITARTRSIVKQMKKNPDLLKKTIITIGVVFLIIVTFSSLFSVGPVTEYFNYSNEGNITLEGIGDFSFDPNGIETIRPDIFNNGHLSVFDVVLHLDKQDLINLKYHFNEELNTYIIDSIDSKNYWWYEAYYDGGWSERNIYRMDHYPYKEKMTIRFYQTSKSNLDSFYSVFRDEIKRMNQNNGKIIIPTVLIRGTSKTLTFYDVVVSPHDLRDDKFQNGVITAIDVIMSLGDQNKLSYDLQYYESIGSAEIVRSYWVERINNDQSYGRCGFVYEAGSNRFNGFRGNHIHIPADTRIINSPEYVEFFWICL